MNIGIFGQNVKFLANLFVKWLPASWILSDIRQRLESKGKRAPLADAMIAATAIANNLILVTRNVKDFESIREVSSLLIEDWSVE